LFSATQIFAISYFCLAILPRRKSLLFLIFVWLFYHGANLCYFLFLFGYFTTAQIFAISYFSSCGTRAGRRVIQLFFCSDSPRSKNKK